MTKKAQQWLKKYYPTPAAFCNTTLECCKHSFKKWKGLEEKTLSEYGLHLKLWGDVEDSKGNLVLEIGNDTCALCLKFNTRKALVGECRRCPIQKATGKPCDSSYESPWAAFKTRKDPKPMLKVLRAAVKWAKENEVASCSKDL